MHIISVVVNSFVLGRSGYISANHGAKLALDRSSDLKLKTSANEPMRVSSS